MKTIKWFYPVPKRSKHEICLNHGESEVCGECHEEWCHYGQDTLTHQIMIDDAARYDKNRKKEKN